jgi:hypothetical protein
MEHSEVMASTVSAKQTFKFIIKSKIFSSVDPALNYLSFLPSSKNL